MRTQESPRAAMKYTIYAGGIYTLVYKLSKTHRAANQFSKVQQHRAAFLL